MLHRTAVLPSTQALTCILAVGHGELEDGLRAHRIVVEELPLIVLLHATRLQGVPDLLVRESHIDKPVGQLLGGLPER